MITSTYTVQPGDCLFTISQRYGESLETIENDNPQVLTKSGSWNLIWPGEQVNIGPASDPAPAPAPSPSSASTSASTSVDGYQNPLRAISGLQAERVDQGVDYGGNGPIYAIGAGVIVNVYNSGWPGGIFIEEKLTGGAFAGKYVYYAEGIQPSVQVGQTVDSSTVIGQMNGGIEIGWGDPGVIGNPAAHDVYGEGESTAFGQTFSQFLVALGAPGGIMETSPVGTVPSGYYDSNTIVAVPVSNISSSSGNSDSGSGSYTAGSASQNLVTIGQFLVNHGYSKAGAAGVAACIAGESGGDPESVGSGGGGLIGWTPLSSMYQYGGTIGGNPTTDLVNQMQAIIKYNEANGNVSELNAQGSPLAAADYYSQTFERPAVTDSDVRSDVAESVYAALGG